MSTDPWNDGEDDNEGSSNPTIRIDREHAGSSRFGLKVDSISDVREGEYSNYVLLVGELQYATDALSGTQDDPEPAPEVGTVVQFLVPFGEGDQKQGHIQEEIDKALRRKGDRGFVKPGDTLHVKLMELKEKNAKGKRYPKGKEFGKHAVKVDRPAPDFGDDRPY